MSPNVLGEEARSAITPDDFVEPSDPGNGFPRGNCLPTRGFSGVSGGLEELINQPLTALATPLPPLTMAQSWHTKSEFDTDSSLVIRRGESSHLSGCLSSPCCSDLLRRPCRFPTHISGCHACARLHVPYARFFSNHGLHPPKSFPPSLVV